MYLGPNWLTTVLFFRFDNLFLLLDFFAVESVFHKMVLKGMSSVQLGCSTGDIHMIELESGFGRKKMKCRGKT